MGSHTQVGQHGPNREDAVFREHGHTQVPQLVQWMVTQSCPLSCPHCLSANNDSRPSSELSLAETARLIEQVAELHVEELLLTGGEPLARPDLSKIIDLLRTHGVRWSLNTAQMPNPRVLGAMEKWPPAFVAVSLDGPPEFHDGFRGRAGSCHEALDAIRTFAKLAPGQVAAGTTVTRQSFRHLSETLGLVATSGATSWGLHLPVPEGRAENREDLFLTRAQLSELIGFVAAKRNHFPVILADEIGYCGSVEPLVRDAPFFCGAGRAQCVILPDGEVVPCTTMDRTTSAGNVREAALAQIWKFGFADLRRWTPKAECVTCDHASACGGGCWLQRRHGTHCFLDVWQPPRAATAASAALCLGLAASGMGIPDADAKPPPSRTAPVKHDASKMEILQRSIIQWYAAQVGGRRAPPLEDVKKALMKALPDDPGAKYALEFIQGQKRPAKVTHRVDAIGIALDTKQRSLCLIGLAWRDLAEWSLDSPSPEKRTADDRRAVRHAMSTLYKTAEIWRQDIFNDKLDVFLRRPSGYRRFFMSKAGPPRSAVMERNLATKRGWTRPDITAAFLEEHPYAEVMDLSLTVTPQKEVALLHAGVANPYRGRFAVFDILRTTKKVTATLKVADTTLRAELPAATELTYADVLRLFYEQNEDPIDKLAEEVMRGRQRKALPVILPAIRRMHLDAARKKTSKDREQLYQTTWWLTDIYLF